MKNQTLKLFGLTKEQISNSLDELALDKKAVKTYVKEKYQDAFLFVEQLSSEAEFDQALAKIVTKLAPYIYADRDISLYERLYEMLTLRKKTIALMEQATGGILTNNLMAFDGAENVVKVSYVVPSVSLMIDHFDLNPFKFTANGGVCGEIAFDIASFIRSRIKSDIYIVSLSTLAEGSRLHYSGGSVISYVAIGTEGGVKIFKTESDAQKRDQMNQLAKTICFKLINLLK